MKIRLTNCLLTLNLLEAVSPDFFYRGFSEKQDCNSLRIKEPLISKSKKWFHFNEGASFIYTNPRSGTGFGLNLLGFENLRGWYGIKQKAPNKFDAF
ncbi:hypothetical protein ACFOG5_00755 [Pedobacter fastidiosus]|uniref:hypothetical protein n=1 Tax=Pedobacter fastidiosus TaxID=2765361 RepID=UPI0036096B96